MNSTIDPAQEISSQVQKENIPSLQTPDDAIVKTLKKPKKLPEPFFRFSAVTIHDFASDSRGESFPVTMSRSQTFPARRYVRGEVDDEPYSKSWAAAPCPEGMPRLELALGSCISQGRIGLVYEAHVRGIIKPNGTKLSPSRIYTLPSTMCIKVARQEHCRSLAREAWVYERLPHKKGYQGVIVPRCWGFFTIPLNTLVDAAGKPLDTIRPWSEIDSDDEPEYEIGKGDEIEDLLPDDDDLECWFDDADYSKESSPWNTWRASRESPLVCVMLMERLEDACHIDEMNVDEISEEALLADLKKVLKDMYHSSVIHSDLRWNNVLRVSPESTRVCPRHKCKHLWHLIDFDRACITDISHDKEDKDTVRRYYYKDGLDHIIGCGLD